MIYLENKFISKDLQSDKIGKLLLILYILTICEMVWNLFTAFGIYLVSSMSLNKPTAADLIQYHDKVNLTIWMAVFALFGLLAVFILLKFRLALWAFIISVVSAIALILIPTQLKNENMGMFEFIFRHCHIVLIPIISLVIWLIGMKEYQKTDKSVYKPLYK